MERREFIKCIVQGGCAYALMKSAVEFVTPSTSPMTALAENSTKLKECMFYKKLDGLRIECEICPKKCRVADMERGYCGNKENHGGKYYTLVYSRPCAIHTDPIEKKPLFHYLPGTTAFSLATAGCNFECKFCQNWEIAQFRPEQVDSIYLSPEDVCREAKRKGAPSVACTYSEPVVFYEYMHDIAVYGRKIGINTVMISNGFIQKEPMEELCKYLAAVKIDLKAFTEKFYKDTCSGELKPVLDTLQLLKNRGMWFEIVVLIIPTLNDSKKEIREMCQWIVKNLGRDVPVHFSRFHPTYKIKNLPITPISTLEMARNTAMNEGVNFAYIGNVPGHPGESTYCPNCRKKIIGRIGYYITSIGIKKGRCVYCNHSIPGIWEM
ncbi:MAG: AmmeMemoRadiSam system radical SAM enzyme [Candidatus Schekmanbacteria bacterium]|nr:MAG: AmmeMemoRadiSam system radical SAM enzyme [Candidatus Schekmanbacteria bacterium]